MKLRLVKLQPEDVAVGEWCINAGYRTSERESKAIIMHPCRLEYRESGVWDKWKPVPFVAPYSL